MIELVVERRRKDQIGRYQANLRGLKCHLSESVPFVRINDRGRQGEMDGNVQSAIKPVFKMSPARHVETRMSLRCLDFIEERPAGTNVHTVLVHRSFHISYIRSLDCNPNPIYYRFFSHHPVPICFKESNLFPVRSRSIPYGLFNQIQVWFLVMQLKSEGILHATLMSLTATFKFCAGHRNQPNRIKLEPYVAAMWSSETRTPAQVGIKTRKLGIKTCARLYNFTSCSLWTWKQRSFINYLIAQ